MKVELRALKESFSKHIEDRDALQKIFDDQSEKVEPLEKRVATMELERVAAIEGEVEDLKEKISIRDREIEYWKKTSLAENAKSVKLEKENIELKEELDVMKKCLTNRDGLVALSEKKLSLMKERAGELWDKSRIECIHNFVFNSPVFAALEARARMEDLNTGFELAIKQLEFLQSLSPAFDRKLVNPDMNDRMEEVDDDDNGPELEEAEKDDLCFLYVEIEKAKLKKAVDPAGPSKAPGSLSKYEDESQEERWSFADSLEFVLHELDRKERDTACSIEPKPKQKIRNDVECSADVEDDNQKM